MARTGKKRRRPDDVWLGSQREGEIAWLQERMREDRPPKEKTLLAREARKVRHGADILKGERGQTFSISARELRIPRIGVF